MLKKLIKIILYSLISTIFLLRAVSAEVMEINFAYIGDSEHSALLGAKQGLDEANLQGQFLNQKYNLDVFSAEDAKTQDFSSYIAVLTNVDTDFFIKLSASLPNSAVFNLSLNDDELRTSCIPNALHIIPSNKMLSDALAQWKQKKPDSNAESKGWHPDFVKFAARDLNKRFKKSHKVTMDDYSWSGWAAVKMTADTVARAQITSADKMLNYLKTELTFDGQKGSNMTFRKTGQLRQLILLIEDNEIVAEAPVRGIAKPPSLDSLGTIDCS